MPTAALWRNLEQVNTVDTATDDHGNPRILQLTNGNTLIAYETSAVSGPAFPPGIDIVAKIYDSQGDLVQDEFRLNNFSTQDNERDFELAASSNGFAVVYEDVGAQDYNIKIDTYSLAGTPLNSTNVIADPDGNNGGNPFFRNPDVTSLSSSTYLTTYEVYNSANDTVSIQGRTFDAVNDVLGGAVTYFSNFNYIGAGEGISHSTTTLTTGEHVVVVANNNANPAINDSISFRLINTDGSITGQPLPIQVDSTFDDAFDPHVVALSNGNFVISWTVENDGQNNEGVRARVYDSDGLSVTPTFSPLTNTAGDQRHSSVGALEDGRFVVVWWDADDRDIHGQTFNADGTEDGGEFNVIGYVNSTVTDLDVEGFEDGRFQVTWNLNLNDAGDVDIRSRIMDPRNAENSPNDYTTDQVVGTIGDDTIIVANADRQVYGWNGDDDFRFSTGDPSPFDQFDGGTGNDRITITANADVNFTQSILRNFEEVEFLATEDSKAAIFLAGQLGGNELAANLHVDGSGFGAAAPDVLRFNMGNQNTLNLENLTFQEWENSFDTLLVVGDTSSETITGSIVDDTIISGGGDDVLNGLAGDDTLTGGSGDDIIDGGTGTDIMSGGDDNDRYIVDSLNDQVIEGSGAGSGFDAIRSSVTVNTNQAVFSENIEAITLTGTDNIHIVGTAGNNVLTGNTGNNVINGQGGEDNMRGRAGNDTYVVDNVDDFVNESLPGSSGNDRVISSISVNLSVASRFSGDIERLELSGSANLNGIGNSVSNLITGNDGRNIINGAGGNDTLTGGMGNDSFVFSTALGTGNVDTITDYGTGADDIRLDDAIFGSFGPTVSASEFYVFGTGPQDANDFLMYNPTNGRILYDADGAGGATRQLFATVDPGTVLDASDFVVI